MNVREINSASTFIASARPLLFEQEFENNLILSSVLALSKQSVKAVRLFLVEAGRNVELGAVLTANGRLVLSSGPAEAATCLVQHCLDQKISLSTVFAPEKQAVLISKDAKSFSTHGTQLLMKCDSLAKIDAAHGLFRQANSRDAKTLIQWAFAFSKECRLDDTPKETEDTIRKFIEHRQAFVWEDGKRPVAMGAFGGVTPKSARISLVYTEPSIRRKGFAGTLVHRLTHRILEEKEAAVLFADGDNPTSVGIYKRLGFAPIEKFTELRALRDSK